MCSAYLDSMFSGIQVTIRLEFYPKLDLGCNKLDSECLPRHKGDAVLAIVLGGEGEIRIKATGEVISTLMHLVY